MDMVYPGFDPARHTITPVGTANLRPFHVTFVHGGRENMTTIYAEHERDVYDQIESMFQTGVAFEPCSEPAQCNELCYIGCPHYRKRCKHECAISRAGKWTCLDCGQSNVGRPARRRRLRLTWPGYVLTFGLLLSASLFVAMVTLP